MKARIADREFNGTPRDIIEHMKLKGFFSGSLTDYLAFLTQKIESLGGHVAPAEDVDEHCRNVIIAAAEVGLLEVEESS